MDNHAFLSLYPAEYPRYGHPSLERDVRGFLGLVDGADRRASVHHLVHSNAVHVRVPWRETAHLRAVSRHSRLDRVDSRRLRCDVARRAAPARDGGGNQGRREATRHCQEIECLEIRHLFEEIYGVLLEHAAPFKLDECRNLLSPVVQEPDAAWLEL